MRWARRYNRPKAYREFWQWHSEAYDKFRGLREIANSVYEIKERPAIKGWGSDDILALLAVMAHQSTLQSSSKSITPPKTGTIANLNSERIFKFSRFLNLSEASYAQRKDDFCVQAKVPIENIYKWNAGCWMMPRHILIVDSDRKEIIVVIRGSATLHDFCADMILVNEPFMNGFAHRGILEASQTVYQHILPLLDQLTQKYPCYKIVFTGHSLGGGVAALLTLKMKPSFPQLVCYSYATPACVTQNLLDSSGDCVTTLICADDCIPRLHETSIKRLHDEISGYSWITILKNMAVSGIEEQLLSSLPEFSTQQVERISRKFQQIAQNQLPKQVLTQLTALERDRNLLVQQIETQIRTMEGFLQSSVGSLELQRDVAAILQASMKRLHEIGGDPKIEHLLHRMYALESTLRRMSTSSYIMRNINYGLARQLDMKNIGQQMYESVENFFSAYCGPTSATEQHVHEHETLYPPGKIYMLLDHAEQQSQIYTVSASEFEKIILSDTMLNNHMCSAYKKVLNNMSKV